MAATLEVLVVAAMAVLEAQVAWEALRLSEALAVVQQQSRDGNMRPSLAQEPQRQKPSAVSKRRCHARHPALQEPQRQKPSAVSKRRCLSRLRPQFPTLWPMPLTGCRPQARDHRSRRLALQLRWCCDCTRRSHARHRQRPVQQWSVSSM